MTKKELCNMCTEHSIEAKCDNEDKCKLFAVIKENKALKEENKALKKEIADLKLNMSYMVNPNAIGNCHEMGCW